MLTVQQVAEALPPNLKTAATQALVDQINNAVSDPIVAEQVRNNFISYSKVLADGKFKTDDYLNAVMYVSYKLMGHSNQDAYFKTFPQRHATLIAAGRTAKDISAYVAMYNKGKLVNLVYECSVIPSWVLNQDAYQKAINTQVELMETSQSDMVRTQAANSLLTHLSKPKDVAQISIDMRETSGMNELKEMMTRMAKQQIDLIESGVTAKEIAAQKIVDVEAKNVT